MRVSGTRRACLHERNPSAGPLAWTDSATQCRPTGARSSKLASCADDGASRTPPTSPPRTWPQAPRPYQDAAPSGLIRLFKPASITVSGLRFEAPWRRGFVTLMSAVQGAEQLRPAWRLRPRTPCGSAPRTRRGRDLGRGAKTPWCACREGSAHSAGAHGRARVFPVLSEVDRHRERRHASVRARGRLSSTRSANTLRCSKRLFHRSPP